MPSPAQAAPAAAACAAAVCRCRARVFFDSDGAALHAMKELCEAAASEVPPSRMPPAPLSRSSNAPEHRAASTGRSQRAPRPAVASGSAPPGSTGRTPTVDAHDAAGCTSPFHGSSTGGTSSPAARPGSRFSAAAAPSTRSSGSSAGAHAAVLPPPLPIDVARGRPPLMPAAARAVPADDLDGNPYRSSRHAGASAEFSTSSRDGRRGVPAYATAPPFGLPPPTAVPYAHWQQVSTPQHDASALLQPQASAAALHGSYERVTSSGHHTAASSPDVRYQDGSPYAPVFSADMGYPARDAAVCSPLAGRLFVAKLSPRTTAASVRSYFGGFLAARGFEPATCITDCYVPLDRLKRPRGFGFVSFSDSAALALGSCSLPVLAALLTPLARAAHSCCCPLRALTCSHQPHASHRRQAGPN